MSFNQIACYKIIPKNPNNNSTPGLDGFKFYYSLNKYEIILFNLLFMFLNRRHFIINTTVSDKNKKDLFLKGIKNIFLKYVL